jgi:hypothetical protein
LKHLSDLLPLAWFGIVIIGVISSIVKSARRQAAKTSPARQPEVRVTGVPQGLHAQFAANAAQLAPPATAPAPRAAVPLPVRRPAPAPARPAPVVPDAPQTVPDYTPPPTSYVPAPLDSAPPPHAMFVQQRPVRAARLFGTPHAVLRSIIASEVLGKPRALRDEY